MDTKVRKSIKENLRNSIRKYVLKFSNSNMQPLDLLIPKNVTYDQLWVVLKRVWVLLYGNQWQRH